MAENKDITAFKLKGDSDNEIQVKRVLDELRKSPVTHYTYRKYYEQWQNTRQIILAQIENESSQYAEQAEQFKEMKEQPRVKSAIQNRVAPIEIYDTMVQLHYRARQIISWKFIEAELSQILIEKYVSVLGEVKAVDVEREVITRLNEMEKGRNALFLEIMQTRFENMDDKFLGALKLLQDEYKVDRRENINVMSTALLTNATVMSDALNSIMRSLQGFSQPPHFDGGALERDLSEVKGSIKTGQKESEQALRSKQAPRDILEELGKLPVNSPSRPKEENDSKKNERDIGFVENPDRLFDDEDIG